jgi:hypothetical protein
LDVTIWSLRGVHELNQSVVFILRGVRELSQSVVRILGVAACRTMIFHSDSCVT